MTSVNFEVLIAFQMISRLHTFLIENAEQNLKRAPNSRRRPWGIPPAFALVSPSSKISIFRSP